MFSDVQGNRPAETVQLAAYKVTRTFVDMGEDTTPMLTRARTKSDPCYRYDSDAGSTRSSASRSDDADSLSDGGASQPQVPPQATQPEPAPQSSAQMSPDAASFAGACVAGGPVAPGACQMMWMPIAVPVPWMMMPYMGVDMATGLTEHDYQMMLMHQQMVQHQAYQQHIAASTELRQPILPQQDSNPLPSPRSQWTPPEVVAQAPGSESSQPCTADEELSLAIAKARAPWRKGKRAQEEAQPQNAEEEPPAQADDRTTLMLRNLPNDLTRNMLIDLLEAEGLAGTFDFLYVPADFGRGAGLGYAFVNFTSNEAALRAWERLKGFTNWGMRSAKVLEVSWAAPLQGLEAYVDRYRNSPVMHERVPKQFKPVLFVGGRRRPLPPPTKTLPDPGAQAAARPAWGRIRRHARRVRRRGRQP